MEQLVQPRGMMRRGRGEKAERRAIPISEEDLDNLFAEMIMASWSLKQNIGEPGRSLSAQRIRQICPNGFNPANGIGSLFPLHQTYESGR